MSDLNNNLPQKLSEVGIEWVVIGAQSGRHPVMPKIEWVIEIANACDGAGVGVWIKNNMKLGIPRQDLPVV